MRKLKFRAWKEDLEIMQYSNEFVSLELFFEEVEYRKPILMQFTGLKTKSGKDIYEGDIVKTKNIKGIKKSSKGTWKVIWNEYSNGFDGELISNEEDDTGEEFECLGNFRDYSVNVIGNIYENSEIIDALHDLKETKEKGQ